MVLVENLHVYSSYLSSPSRLSLTDAGPTTSKASSLTVQNERHLVSNGDADTDTGPQAEGLRHILSVWMGKM